MALAQWVQERGKYKFVVRTAGWPYPRHPMIVGILSKDNLRIDSIALMFDPPNQKMAFRFQEEDIWKASIAKRSAAEIVAAIVPD